MTGIFTFQILHFKVDWLNPYYILQVIIDTELLRVFWIANRIPILVSCLLVLSIFWLVNRALKSCTTNVTHRRKSRVRKHK